jgi:RNA polymerase sigma-70 factor (sigma-E family)
VNKTQTDEPGWTPRLDGRASGANPGPPAAAHPGGRDIAVIFRQHHADLVRLALLLVGDRASAEDVVQDVFTRLCARDRELHGDTALAYVRTAVVNACRTVLRRRALGRRIAAARAEQGPGTQESAEHTAIQAEDRRRVMAALAALPARRREVLVLRFYFSLPVAEVATMLGISPGSVKSATARGLATLNRRLGEGR